MNEIKIYKVIDLIFYNKRFRRLILIFGDLFFIPFSIIFSLYLKYDSNSYNIFDYSWLFVFIIFFSLPVYILLGQYKSLSSYFGFRILIDSFLRNILISLLAYIFKNNKWQIIDCVNVYKEFPEFEKIEKNSNTKLDYLKSWEEIEKLYDNRYPKLNDNDQKIVGPTHNLINLSDILIIKNWITYAYLINDISYSKICNHEIKDSYLNNFIKDQIKFRQKCFH